MKINSVKCSVFPLHLLHPQTIRAEIISQSTEKELAMILDKSISVIFPA